MENLYTIEQARAIIDRAANTNGLFFWQQLEAIKKNPGEFSPWTRAAAKVFGVNVTIRN
jgi:hypothetical protein